MKLVLSLCVLFSAHSALAQDYALDDAHNHDGTHVEGQTDCGGNYMFPGDVARLGSHSFLILGEDGPNHLLLDHRSGTPPHTYQFILRVRADANEMATYRKLLKESKVGLPAVTTIYFDKTGKQVDRTFFCLPDLPKIFGPEQKAGDAYAKLFPIRASWQKDADFEGAFPIKESVMPEDPFVIERKDVEIVLYRYLPSYLEQSGFRKLVKARGGKFTSLLSHAPIRADEGVETAVKRTSYVKSGAFDSNGETCSADYYLKTVRPPKTKHAFLLLAEAGKNSVLAAHFYDQSPQNYQTTVHFEFSDAQMKMFRDARAKSKTPLIFMPDLYFCMNEIKDLVKRGALPLKGAVYADSNFEEFRLGTKVGELAVGGVKVLVNRTLQSLMNPQAVARDVFGFVDLKTVNSDIHVEALYAAAWNFTGAPVDGYRGNKCYLTSAAAKALSAVQKDVAKQGYSLLVLDCYRPQRSVDSFVAWTKDAGDVRMKSVFYPEEDKALLFKRGYIDAKSGHSRGSTVDLTLVRAGKFEREKFLQVAAATKDCRSLGWAADAGVLEMGTSFDCFSELSQTGNFKMSAEVLKNRGVLKAAMEKHGFGNYPKEWWHFVLKGETFKAEYFDFEVE